MFQKGQDGRWHRSESGYDKGLRYPSEPPYSGVLMSCAVTAAVCLLLLALVGALLCNGSGHIVIGM